MLSKKSLSIGICIIFNTIRVFSFFAGALRGPTSLTPTSLLFIRSASSQQVVGYRKIGQAVSSNAAANGVKLAATTVAGEASTSASTSASSISTLDRKKGALLGLYVADATAMPVHWMYSLYQLQRDYGVIRGYVKPKDRFEGSIMNLSNTGGGGRGSDKGDIIGDVINHGKKKYWGRGLDFHYHVGLEAGENTLEAQLTRLLARGIIEKGEFDKQYWLQQYIAFLTTPGSHNDTYASTCHRMFFANYVRDIPPDRCADNDGHNTDAIDALTNLIPVIVHYAEHPRTERNQKIAEVISSTRKSRVLQSYAENFGDILVEVLHGADLRESIERYGAKSIRRMVESSRGDPMVACYIDSAYPAMLFFAYKYADSVEEAILASANAGGENVARGACVGALLGAAHGTAAFPAWAHKLKNHDAIVAEIDTLASLSSPPIAGNL